MYNRKRSSFFTKDSVKHEADEHENCSEPLYDCERMLKEDNRWENCKELACCGDDTARQRSKCTHC